MIKRTPHNLRRAPMLALLASLAGLLLTHGIVIACLIYCAFIHPGDMLICEHHYGAASADSRPAGPRVQPAGAPSPILERGSELPLALAVLLAPLVWVRARRRAEWSPAIRWASWILPLAAPPPRRVAGGR
jgi:hypothetical protein